MTEQDPGPSRFDWATVVFVGTVFALLIVALLAKAEWCIQ